MTFSVTQRAFCEGLGTMLLLAIVVGSGIMGEQLAGGNTAIALLGNTLATGAGLTVLILIFGPVSGAHFNPAVTLAFWLQGALPARDGLIYIAAQFVFGLAGVWLAHSMFDLPIWQISATARDSGGMVLGEVVATFGLVLTILACIRFRPESTPYAVGLFITAGYWFTSSTSFANPAVTIARSLTDTFAGIAPASAPAFIGAEIAGAVLAVFAARALLGIEKQAPPA